MSVVARLRVAERTEVIVSRGLPKPILTDRSNRARAAVVTQPAPTSTALEVARSLEEEEGLKTEVIGLPDREEAKTLDVATSVYEALAKFGLSRYDTVVGVGGGTVTDLAGYVAGTWLRGVESVYVSTTLLGAVDASIGGKTGVNLGGKNLVGVFWHPTRVLIDVDVLERLPTYLIREGMAEAYKSGLIGDVALVDLIASNGLESDLSEVVERSLIVKSRIVDADQREDDVRAVLNFGHTIGHAIEYASALSHGEAVSLGMVAAAVISEKVTGFEGVAGVKRALSELGLPISVDGLDLTRVLDLLRRDKKRDASGMRMILLEAIERPVIRYIDDEDVELGLSAIGF